LRPLEIDELVAGYKAGATVYQLAERFRIHRATVSLLLERQCVPRRNRPLSPAQIDHARMPWCHRAILGQGRDAARMRCEHRASRPRASWRAN